MVFEMNIGLLVIIGLVIIALIAGIAFIIWGLKHAIRLAINSLIGFFALWLVKATIFPDILINLWSVLLVAIFGIFGFVAVILLHLFGLAF